LAGLFHDRWQGDAKKRHWDDQYSRRKSDESKHIPDPGTVRGQIAEPTG
jgi:hypothetical protein